MHFVTLGRPGPIESSRWGWSRRRAAAHKHHQHQQRREHHQHGAWLGPVGSTRDGREQAARATGVASTTSISATPPASAPAMAREHTGGEQGWWQMGVHCG